MNTLLMYIVGVVVALAILLVIMLTLTIKGMIDAEDKERKKYE